MNFAVDECNIVSEIYENSIEYPVTIMTAQEEGAIIYRVKDFRKISKSITILGRV